MRSNISRPIPLFQILACAAVIVTLSMGIRHGFGLWLQPMTQAHNWSRETFSLAMAVQNIFWGLAGIFVGMVADRFGAFRVLLAGAATYALGLTGMALSDSIVTFMLSTGVLIGIAQSATTFAVVYGVIGRNVAEDRRSWAMGVAAAAGSFGQFLMVPLEGFLIRNTGWQPALLVLAAAVLLIALAAFGLREPAFGSRAERSPQAQSSMQALREAWQHRGFLLLTAGFFVCGFQVVFIGVHMPSYLKDHGLAPEVAGYALALIGLFNVVGTYLAGLLGQRLRKSHILSVIYLGRSVVIALFIATPLSPMSVYLFSACMGLLWLSTVPPTNAAIAHIFGVQHLSMLSGFVFFSHQIGSFLGVWLGGLLYDLTGQYDLVWHIAIGLGIVAAMLNLPVRETALVRPSYRAA